MGTESELKLTTAPRDLQRVRRQAWLHKLISGPVKVETLVSVYFDSDTLKLHKHGISLRIRKIGRKRLQTIKAMPDGSNGVFGRQEWETEIAGRSPNYDLAKNTALGPLLTPKLKRDLRPIFETKIERTKLPVRVGDSLIEVALDRGQIRTTRHRQPVCEIELELTKGKPSDVARLGKSFLHNIPVAYGVHAKADRGYALVAEMRDKAVEAVAITLLPNASVADSFALIGLACLDHIARNEEAVLRGNSEGVHQMRVGLRRLRAAISIFKNTVRGSQTEKIKAELRWLTEALGPARDFDVLVDEGVMPLQRANPKSSEIALLKTDLIKRRHSGFDMAKAAVKSNRYKKLILETALWLANGKWLRNYDPLAKTKRRRLIRDYAADVLESRAKKVVKKIAHFKSLDAQHRHKLRIAAKKLRYAAEFFESLFQKKKSKAGREEFENSLKALQDALGTLNDIAVHGRLAQKYAHPKQPGRRRPAKAFAMGLLTGHEQTKAKGCMALAMEAGKRLRDAPRYWRK